MKIRPGGRIIGTVTLSGDKSISHRAALIAAMARGSSRLLNFSNGQDCASTLECLRQLGVSIEVDSNTVQIAGRGLNGFAKPKQILDCGNSGSTMRMLAGILTGQNFVSRLTGDESLRSRPMGRIIEPLERMGSRIDSSDGKPPLTISGSDALRPIRYELRVPSAQVKSSVLLAGLQTQGRTAVIEAGTTRDHTERMLRWFGAAIEVTSRADLSTEIAVNGRSQFDGREVRVPGDISSAAFIIAAAALLPGSDLTIKQVGVNPTRARIISELRSLGATVTIDEIHEVCNEPVGNVRVAGDLRVSSHQTGPHAIPAALIPQLIDELPLLAVFGTQVSGGIEIRNAAELRIKESDRLAATALNLRAMGAEVEEYADGLKVNGPTRLRGALIQTVGDHRIALAFAVAALIADGESEIDQAECVAVSFPEFFDLLSRLVVS